MDTTKIIATAKKACVMACMVAIGAVAATTVDATVAPGTAADPLVTKSYVDDKIGQITGVSPQTSTNTAANNQAIVTDVLAQIEFLYGAQLKGQATDASPTDGVAGDTFQPVSLSAGQSLTGHEGTEIILRSGKATARCPGDNGLVNVTSGKDVANGGPVGVNHFLIVPRADGRGVTAKTDVWLLVKGSYDIVD